MRYAHNAAITYIHDFIIERMIARIAVCYVLTLTRKSGVREWIVVVASQLYHN